VLRYEIKNITPPHDVLAAMEKQMRANGKSAPSS
jgi:regulator of protease activity HflC (stomatin/prohibitin superfamily)